MTGFLVGYQPFFGVLFYLRNLQIGETITMIAWLDFPGKWPTLLSDLTCKFNSGEIDAVLGSLRTAHGLFKQ